MSNETVPPTLRWRDQLAIALHELTVSALIVSDVVDRRDAKECDFSRLALARMRLQALMEYGNGFT